MFIEFHFGNFRSFRDNWKFSLEASPARSNDYGENEENIFTIDDIRLLKTKAIYGANASGKSNLAKAISAFSYMVSRSVAEEGISSKLWNDRFQLITNWDDQPIFFQYVFLHEHVIYRYGFQVLQNRVSYEWLYELNKTGQHELFMRSPEGIKLGENRLMELHSFVEQTKEEDNELFRIDSLFLTAAALNGNKFCIGLRNEIRGIFSVDGMNDVPAINYGLKKLSVENSAQKEVIIELLKATDTGIEGLELSDIPENFSDPQSTGFADEELSRKNMKGLFSHHSRFDEDGKVVDQISVPFAAWESQGTSKLFGIGSLIIDALVEGRVIVIDEFDARLHPNLTLKIVKLFNNEKTNPKNAQLIFVTHDTDLLKRAKLRRDQICLVDKDRYGISSLHSLIEYKGVRKDASFEKEYLDGKYSAVPYLEQLDRLFVKKDKEDGVQ